MMSSFVDLELPQEEESSGDAALQACPVYVAVVDLSSSEEFLELTKSALLAALEGIMLIKLYIFLSCIRYITAHIFFVIFFHSSCSWFTFWACYIQP